MSEDKRAPSEGRASADRAAAKIQAGFRGYRVRKRLQQERGETGEQQRNGFDSEQQNHHMEEVTLQPIAVPATVEDKSATKIQAGIRGFLVRKRQQAEQVAATKIQAGFRGFRTRKLLKQTGQ